MSHQWTNALSGGWYNGYIVTSADLGRLDGLLALAINGDGGNAPSGPYVPTSPIVVGGAGMWFGGQSGLSTNATVVTAAGKPITLGDSDYPLLKNSHPAESRVLITPILRSFNNQGFNNEQSVKTGARLILPLRVVQNATLSSAVVRVSVNGSHSSLPTYMPKVRICATDGFGNVTILTESGTGDQFGFVSCPTPANVSDWNAATIQTWTWTAAAGVVINRGEYVYWAELVDEAGGGALTGNHYYSVEVEFTGIADLRPS